MEIGNRFFETERVKDCYDEACSFARHLFRVINNTRTMGRNVKGFRLVEEDDAVAVVYEALCIADKYYSEESGRAFMDFAKDIVFQKVVGTIDMYEGRKRHRCKESLEIVGEDRLVLFSELVNGEGESMVDYLTGLYSMECGEDEEIRRSCREDADRRMSRLTDNQRRVVYLLFGIEGDEHTVQEVAAMLGVSGNHVSKVKNTALRIMEED